jgi:hypothetical protein
MADGENDNHDLIELDTGDDPDITDAVSPRASEIGLQRLAELPWVVEWRHALRQIPEHTGAIR